MRIEPLGERAGDDFILPFLPRRCLIRDSERVRRGVFLARGFQSQFLSALPCSNEYGPGFLPDPIRQGKVQDEICQARRCGVRFRVVPA